MSQGDTDSHRNVSRRRRALSRPTSAPVRIRPRLGVAALLLAITAAVAIAGCGGGDHASAANADDYRASLDSSCQGIFDEIRALPQKQVDEDLTSAEIGRLATEAEGRFVDDVAALAPPAGLEADHEQLLETLRGPGGGLEEVKARAAALADVYANLGARRCESLQRETLSSLESIPPDAGR